MKMLKKSAFLRKFNVEIVDKSWIILRYQEHINTYPMQKKNANFKKESLKLLNRERVSPTRRALNQH